MAIVELEKNELERMVGRKLSERDYMEVIPMFGCPLEKMEKDSVKFEVSPNRPDILSVEGFARAIRNFSSKKPKLTDYKIAKGKTVLKVDTNVKSVRPFIGCGIVRNVNMTDGLIASLMQIQEKLHDTLGRKRKKVAIGIHDFSKIEPPFTYKAVLPEELKFVPLDMDTGMTPKEILEKHPKGVDYAHILDGFKKWPMLVDSKERVLSFPPIINGELTRVTEKSKTLFIDITGTDERAVDQALNIMATLFLERGCVVESVQIVDKNRKTKPELARWKIGVSVPYISKILGVELNKSDIKKLLERMDIGFDGRSALVPAYRTDVMHQMDIAEDVAIAYGYNNFEIRIPKVATIGAPLKENDYYYTIKQILIGCGFQEVISLTLSNANDEFTKMEVEPKPVAETLNSVTPECNMCRRDVLPSVMDVLSQNQHREYPQKVFELGDSVILDSKEETGVRIVKKLACVISDTIVSYADISSILDSLMENIGKNYKLENATHPSFIEGRVARIVCNGKHVGFIGEVHPKVLKNWKIEMPVAAFELELYE